MNPALTPICGLGILAWQLGMLDVDDLWLLYSALGGSADRMALDLYLNGLAAWPVHEQNVLSQALNEQLWDTGQPSLAPTRACP